MFGNSNCPCAFAWTQRKPSPCGIETSTFGTGLPVASRTTPRMRPAGVRRTTTKFSMPAITSRLALPRRVNSIPRERSASTAASMLRRPVGTPASSKLPSASARTIASPPATSAKPPGAPFANSTRPRTLVRPCSVTFAKPTPIAVAHDVAPLPFALAVEGDGDEVPAPDRHVLGAVAALRVGGRDGDDVLEALLGEVADEDACARVPHARPGLEHDALDRAARDHLGREHDGEVAHLARRIEHARSGARAAGPAGRFDRERAERHAEEGEAAVGVGVESAPEFARIRIGEEIHRRAGRRRHAVGLEDGAEHGAAAAEAQRHRDGRADARRDLLDRVAQQRAVEPLGRRDRLGQRAGEEALEQGPLRRAGREFEQALAVEPLVAARLEDQRLGLAARGRSCRSPTPSTECRPARSRSGSGPRRRCAPAPAA